MTDARTTVSRAAGVVQADVGETRVLLGDSLTYHGLEGTAQRIWDLLDGPRTVDEIVDALLTEYDVTRENCLASVVRLADELAERGLVTLS